MCCRLRGGAKLCDGSSRLHLLIAAIYFAQWRRRVEAQLRAGASRREAQLSPAGVCPIPFPTSLQAIVSLLGKTACKAARTGWMRSRPLSGAAAPSLSCALQGQSPVLHSPVYSSTTYTTYAVYTALRRERASRLNSNSSSSQRAPQGSASGGYCACLHTAQVWRQQVDQA